jgi:predicted transcriptional regulator
MNGKKDSTIPGKGYQPEEGGGIYMTSITLQLDDNLVEALRRLAAAQQRSETEIMRDALIAYTETKRPLPKGIGEYHSGRSDGSEKARALLRDAVKEGLWP